MDYRDRKEQQVIRYIDSVQHKWRKFPVGLHISLTDHCYNQCITCSHWRRKNKRRYPLPLLLNLLEFGKNNQLETVVYTGGDPFAYGTELNALMQWHIDSRVPFGFVTSGYVPLDVMDIARLERCSFVSISLDAIGNELYSACRGGIPFDLVDTSLKTLVNVGVNVRIAVTLHKLNYQALPEICGYAIRNNIKEIRVSTVFGCPPILLGDHDKLTTLLRECKLSLDSNGITHNFDYLINHEATPFNSCRAVLLQSYVDAGGNLFPCCILAGDTQEQESVDPICNLLEITPEKWESCRQRIDDFSESTITRFPVGCRNCTRRFRIVNSICDKLWEKQNFI